MPNIMDESARVAKRREDLTKAIETITKEHGKGAIMRLGDPGASVAVSSIPTGALSLDIALGVGGIPRGRITEIYGPESAGKSTLAQHIIAEAQRNGGMAAYIDVEHALDPEYAAQCGINIEEMLISQPDTGEQALEICEALIRSNALDVVIVDSVAALVPRAEIEGDMGDSMPGLQARLMSQAMRKLTGAVARSNTALVFINQLREKIGVMFGSPEVTPGGRALKFYSSVRIEIRRVESLKQGSSATASAARWSRTRWRRRSARLSSTLCSPATSTASTARATSSTWRRSTRSSRSSAPSTRTATSASDRAVRRRATSCAPTRR
jgi:recombination protein RecA